jgi:hypothetical protein
MNSNSQPPVGAAAHVAASRRAAARRELAACWNPLWDAVDPLWAMAVGRALIKRGADEATAPLEAIVGREQSFAQAFRERLRGEYDAALAEYASPQAPVAPQDRSKLTLSLVDFDDMELSTLVERASARIRNGNEELYSLLRLRVAGMSGEIDLRDSEFPFRPAVFYRAVDAALLQIGIAPEHRLKLLIRFDQPLVGVVGAAYRALEKHLNARGHAPKLPGGNARNTVIRRLSRSSTRQVTDFFSSDPSGDGDGWTMRSGAHAEQVLQSLYQRLQVPMAPGSLIGMPTPLPLQPGGRVPVGVAGGVPMAPGAAAGLTGSVTLPVGMPGGYLPGPGAPLMPAGATSAATIGAPTVTAYVDPALIGAIHNIQRLSAMALAAAGGTDKAPDAAVDQAELRDKLSEKATRQVDKLTIEIVGLLFERIERDRHVPRKIKDLLQRLQFPIIKAALTDPELFVAPDRAPRVLIDRIAATAVGWTPEGAENERYLNQVQKAVNTVLCSVEEGLNSFEQALADFEAYLLEERGGDDDPVTRAKRALAEAETREIMAINATIKIRSAFDGVRLESYLREFLLQTWVRVLVAAWVKDNGEEAAMQKYLGIVPDLVWSVQPKIDPADRKRLVMTIPAVLGTLREGLLLIEYPADRMQEFFGLLMQSHAHAVKALEMAHGLVAPAVEQQAIRAKLKDLRMSAEPPPADAAQDIRVSDAVVKQVLAARGAPVDHLDAPSAGGSESDADVSDTELDRLIDGWKRGDWFNLKLDGAVERVQLRWISPRRSLFLFTPADGQRSHSLAPEAIRARLRSGELSPVEPAPLFERAVQGLMVRLQNAADGIAAGAA